MTLTAGAAATIPMLPPGGRVALLGGSFDPPHMGHVLLAATAIATAGVDALWVIPCADHPFGKTLSPFQVRVALCHAAFSSLRSTHVVEIESHLTKPSYTVQTLRALHAARPGASFTWLVGSDVVAHLPRWREPEALRTLCRLFVVPRGSDTQGDVPFALPAVASSAIRDALRHGDDVAGWLPTAVREHIDSERLYRNENPPS